MNKIDEVNGPETDKEELIKLELFMDPDSLV
jgi:hypothetical protein